MLRQGLPNRAISCKALPSRFRLIFPVLAVSAFVAPKARAMASKSGYTDVVPGILSRGIELRVRYGETQVTEGMDLTAAQAAHEPSVQLVLADESQGLTAEQFKDTQFTLAMVDPDAPSPDKATMKEWLHWLVVNMPGGDVKHGSVLCAYAGPSPPAGRHRYIFLAYQQPPGVILKKPHDPLAGNRGKFSITDWAEAHRLGDPIAATMFYTAAKH